MKTIQRALHAAALCLSLVLLAGCVVDQYGRVIIGAPVVVEDYHVQYFRQRAEQGDAVAQFTLGTYYEHGWGVVRNYAEAARWYRRSAQQGYAAAQNRLGDYFYNGFAVPQNYAKAVAWYSKAAAQGYPSAVRSLQVCASRGLVPGTPPPTTPAPSPTPPATPGTPPPENAFTVDQIKELSSAGVKADTIISQIKTTNSRFSAQDIALAQQASPPIDPTVIAYMKNPAN